MTHLKENATIKKNKDSAKKKTDELMLKKTVAKASRAKPIEIIKKNLKIILAKVFSIKEVYLIHYMKTRYQ